MMQARSQITYTSEVLLINPPFDWVTSPYISIPVLASYLQNRHISVSAYDMKQEFYAHVLTSQNILRGLRYAKERFIDLNNAPKLHFSQIVEYRLLLMLLAGISKFKKAIQNLLSPFSDFRDIQNSEALHFFILAATYPHFPEIILQDFTALSLSTSGCSAYNPYSSADILQASAQSDYYTQLFGRILDEKILSNHHPRIIGFSVVFPAQIIPAFQCAYLLKKRLPDVHITMGGPSISVHFREVREKRLFDIINSLVLDEGEQPLEMLVRELSTQAPDLSKIPGLIYCADDQIQINPSAPPLDLRQSSPPDYTVFQLDKYLFSKDILFIPLRFSKGCRWKKCAFCRTTLPMYQTCQSLSPELAYRQLVHVIHSTGISNFIFSDEMSDPRVLEYISKRLLEDRMNIHWVTQTRISKHLTQERCKLYRKAGCMMLELGIESFSDRILQLMRKGNTVERIEETLHAIDGNVPVSALMIIGFPTESEEEALQGYERLKALIANSYIHSYYYSVFTIHSGSDIWIHPENYGISEMTAPQGSDLLPDMIKFTGTGMSRERTYQLANRFMNASPIDKQLMKISYQEWSHNTIQIDDHIIPVRYDAQKIEDLLVSKSFTDLPFIHWLNMTEGEMYPSNKAEEGSV